MLHAPRFCSLALLSLATSAHAEDVSCNIESDYDLSINPQSVILTRDSGTPKWIVIRGDKLFVDDRWVALGTKTAGASPPSTAAPARSCRWPRR